MARKRSIPALVPSGTKCRRVDTYEQKSTDRRSYAERNADNPWRRDNYFTAEYRHARQAVLDRTRGRCASCGATIAERGPKGWRMKGGEVHHVRALSEGGSNSQSNLVPLCIRCHHAADAARRRARTP